MQISKAQPWSFNSDRWGVVWPRNLHSTFSSPISLAFPQLVMAQPELRSTAPVTSPHGRILYLVITFLRMAERSPQRSAAHGKVLLLRNFFLISASVAFLMLLVLVLPSEVP